MEPLAFPPYAWYEVQDRLTEHEMNVPASRYIFWCIVALFGTAGIAGAQGNLMRNGSFELSAGQCGAEWTSSKCPTDFALKTVPDGDAPGFAVWSAEGDNGALRFRLSNPRSDVRRAFTLSQTVLLPAFRPASVYELSAWIRTDRVKAGVESTLRVFDADLPRAEPLAARSTQLGTSSWQRVPLLVQTSSRTRSLKLELEVAAPEGVTCEDDCGAIWIDNLELRSVSRQVAELNDPTPFCTGQWKTGSCPAGVSTVTIPPEAGVTAYSYDPNYNDGVARIEPSPGASYRYVALAQPFEIAGFGVENGTLLYGARVKSQNLHPGLATSVELHAITSERRIVVGTYRIEPSSEWMTAKSTVPIPHDAERVELLVSVAAWEGLDCGVSGCGALLVDDLFVTSAPRDFENVCAEGDFLNLMTRECLALDKSFGVDIAELERTYVGLIDTVLSPSSCTRGELASLLRYVGEAGGGTVRVPACVLEGREAIRVPGRTRLQGAGIGRTVIKGGTNQLVGLFVSGSFGNKETDVTIRDLTLDVSDHQYVGINPLGLMVIRAENVLVERVEILGRANGILHPHTRGTVIRYNAAHDLAAHGIGSKDCQDYDPIPPAVKVSKSEACDGQGKDPDFWANDFAIYSNYSMRNGGDGIDSHASLGEIAGNIVAGNKGSSKYPEPARFVWIHHNTFLENLQLSRTVKIDKQYQTADSTLAPGNIAFYKNVVMRNRGLVFRIKEARQIYLIDNVYENNLVERSVSLWDLHEAGSSVLRISESNDPLPEVFVCASTDDVNLEVDVAPSLRQKVYFELPETDSRCDLSNVAQLFDRVGKVSTSAGYESVPSSSALGQNYPNPFSHTTRVPFVLSEQARVDLGIFNMLGQRVATLIDGVLAAGTHEAVWDGSGLAGQPLPGGVYIYRLFLSPSGVEGSRETSRGMILVR